jgi:thioredoxin-dependent peroxiredoxin
MEIILLKEGDKAPDFHVVDDSGTTRSLKDFHGKNLILYFYPKANTPG